MSAPAPHRLTAIVLLLSMVASDRAGAQHTAFEFGIAHELGGGNAWREGRDLPYLVTAARLTVASVGSVRVNLRPEHSLLRDSTGSWRVTYAEFIPISSEPLGRTHQWSHALLVGVSGSGRLF